MGYNLTVSEILNCTKGKLICGDLDFACKTFSKDTRTIQTGDIYIGIKGENFDGNMFWEDALKSGAKGVIVQGISFSSEKIEEYKDKVIIQVSDTLEALYEIAKLKRSHYSIPVIAITGSVGKTSTKDIISNVVSQKYVTLKTEGNNNNNIGLPFTILRLQDHEAMVLEMGMNHFDEIKLLSKIAKPTLSVITNIGTSHIGNLGSRENILKAKLEILEGMEEKNIVINNDNDLLSEWEKQDRNCNIYTYGIENQSDAMAKDIKMEEKSSSFICQYDNEAIDTFVPVGGIHFVYNALCAVTVGRILGISNESIKKGIETFSLTKKRMDMIHLKNDVTVINDSYNASYESMKVAIEYLKNLNGKRKIAILGDMLELGEYSEELHEKVAEEVVKNEIDLLICKGELAKFIVEKAILLGMEENKVLHFETVEEIIEFLKDNMKEQDVILLKASMLMNFSRIADALKNI